MKATGMMKFGRAVWLAVVVTAAMAVAGESGFENVRRSRGDRPTETTEAVRRAGTDRPAEVEGGGEASGFAKFSHKAWVTGVGRVTRILVDDLDPPCHQRFILADESGRTILVANSIEGWDRVEGLEVGDTVAFKGEFISTARGGLVHWTHPDPSHRKPGGWVRKVESEKAESAVDAEIVALPSEEERTEYFAGRGPIASRTPAPVNDVWPETGYWLSTNSGARHNKRCENYRKTRGYPCKKNEGRPCGKCGG